MAKKILVTIFIVVYILLYSCDFYWYKLVFSWLLLEGIPRFSCDETTHYHEGDDTLCNLQIWVTVMEAWIQIFLFVIVLLNIFMMIKFPATILKYSRLIQWIYHIMLFVPPFMILIVIQATGTLDYNYGSSLCRMLFCR